MTLSRRVSVSVSLDERAWAQDTPNTKEYKKDGNGRGVRRVCDGMPPDPAKYVKKDEAASDRNWLLITTSFIEKNFRQVVVGPAKPADIQLDPKTIMNPMKTILPKRCLGQR